MPTSLPEAKVWAVVSTALLLMLVSAVTGPRLAASPAPAPAASDDIWATYPWGGMFDCYSSFKWDYECLAKKADVSGGACGAQRGGFAR
jgi:hypothetical protein